MSEKFRLGFISVLTYLFEAHFYRHSYLHRRTAFEKMMTGGADND